MNTEFRRAFKRTLPFLAAFTALGAGLGFLACGKGLAWYVPPIMSIVIFAGSMEFLTVDLLLSPFAPLSTALLALAVNGRHFFYGLTMLEKYAGAKRFKPYLIYALCDETFAVNATERLMPDTDPLRFYFWVSLLNQCYWTLGVTVGSLAGTVMTPPRGVEFILPSLFVLLALEAMKKRRHRIAGAVGLGSALICLRLFGPGTFTLPALALITALLFLHFKRGKKGV